MACVAAPIIGGTSTPTHRNDAPHLRTSIGSSYHTLNREKPENLNTRRFCSTFLYHTTTSNSHYL